MHVRACVHVCTCVVCVYACCMCVVCVYACVEKSKPEVRLEAVVRAGFDGDANAFCSAPFRVPVTQNQT